MLTLQDSYLLLPRHDDATDVQITVDGIFPTVPHYTGFTPQIEALCGENKWDEIETLIDSWALCDGDANVGGYSLAAMDARYKLRALLKLLRG